MFVQPLQHFHSQAIRMLVHILRRCHITIYKTNMGNFRLRTPQPRVPNYGSHLWINIVYIHIEVELLRPFIEPETWGSTFITWYDFPQVYTRGWEANNGVLNIGVSITYEGSYNIRGSHLLIGHSNFGTLFHLLSRDKKALADWSVPSSRREFPVTTSPTAPMMHCIIRAFPTLLLWFFANLID